MSPLRLLHFAFHQPLGSDESVMYKVSPSSKESSSGWVAVYLNIALTTLTCTKKWKVSDGKHYISHISSPVSALSCSLYPVRVVGYSILSNIYKKYIKYKKEYINNCIPKLYNLYFTTITVFQSMEAIA